MNKRTKAVVKKILDLKRGVSSNYLSHCQFVNYSQIDNDLSK